MIKAEHIGSRPTLGGRSNLTRKPLYPSTPERPPHGLKRRNAPSRWEGRARSGLAALTIFTCRKIHLGKFDEAR